MVNTLANIITMAVEPQVRFVCVCVCVFAAGLDEDVRCFWLNESCLSCNFMVECNICHISLLQSFLMISYSVPLSSVLIAFSLFNPSVHLIYIPLPFCTALLCFLVSSSFSSCSLM